MDESQKLDGRHCMTLPFHTKDSKKISFYLFIKCLIPPPPLPPRNKNTMKGDTKGNT